MDVLEAIRTRRSIRRFQDRDVPDELIEKILSYAIWAPSAGNLQPWEFIVVRDSDRKLRLARAALGQYFIAEAPVVVVLCANTRRSESRYGSRGRNLYSIIDASLAGYAFMLAAHALGLGTCWIGAFHDEEVSEILELPPYVRPIGIFPLGYPAEKPSPPPRFSVREVTHRERFGERW